MIKRFLISLKQVRLYLRSYLFLISVISLGFGVINILTSYSTSMAGAVYNSSRSHYGGDLFVLGSDKQSNGMLVIDDRVAIEEIVQASAIPYDKIYKRTNLLNTGIIYFNGTGVRQKNIYGVDFSSETDTFSSMDYDKGGVPLDDTGILISNVTAEKLGADIGDLVTVKVFTRSGQVNTGALIVSGIVNDPSILGSYRSFIKRSSLNKLLNVSEDSYSSLGLIFNSDEKGYERELYSSLSKLNISNELFKKTDLTWEMDKHWEGVRHFVIPLSLYISQVSDLLLAMDLVTYLLYLIIGIIVIISVFVTQNVILRSRSCEIASIRAIGFTKVDVFNLIIGESIIVLVGSLILGSIISQITFLIVSNINFRFIPGFEFFLKNGRLLPGIDPYKILFNIAIVALSVLPSTVISIKKILNKPIIDGLIGRLK